MVGIVPSQRCVKPVTAVRENAFAERGTIMSRQEQEAVKKVN